jgi:hypothetical protein
MLQKMQITSSVCVVNFDTVARFYYHLVGLFGILQSSTRDGTKWHDMHIKVASPMSQKDILGTRCQTPNIANPAILVTNKMI